jgi:hypothetical protein
VIVDPLSTNVYLWICNAPCKSINNLQYFSHLAISAHLPVHRSCYERLDMIFAEEVQERSEVGMKMIPLTFSPR